MCRITWTLRDLNSLNVLTFLRHFGEVITYIDAFLIFLVRSRNNVTRRHFIIFFRKRIIQSIGQEGGYTFVFENMVPLYTGADVKDITDEVKARLGVN